MDLFVYIHLYHMLKGTAFKVKEKKSFKQKAKGIMLMKKAVREHVKNLVVTN